MQVSGNQLVTYSVKMTRWRESGSAVAAIRLIHETATILEDAGHKDVSAELLQALKTIERATPYSRKQAFASIVAMCHPKWHGDIIVQGMEWAEWNTHLANLEKTCLKAFQKLESEFSALSEEERLQQG